MLPKFPNKLEVFMHSKSLEPSIETVSTDIGAWLDECASELSSSDWGALVDTDGIQVLDLVHSLLFYYLINQRTTQNKGEPSGSAKAASALSRLSSRYPLRQAVTNATRIYSRSREQACEFSGAVMFMPSEPTHLKVQLPLAQELRTSGHKTQFAVWDPFIYDAVGQAGYEPLFIYNPRYWLDSVRDHRVKAGIRDCGPMNLPEPHFDCDAALLKYSVEDYLRRNLPRLSRLKANTKRFMEQVPTNTVIVVGYDLTPQGRLATIYAQRKGLKTAVIEHGFPPLKSLAKRQIADRIFVYGEHGRKRRESVGLDSARVSVCGCSGFDERPVQTGKVDTKIETKLGVGAGRPWMLVATSGPGGVISLTHHRKVIEGLFRLSEEVAEVDFVVKLHRKDKREYYEEAANQFPNHRLILVDSSSAELPTGILSWFQGCTGVLTGSSNVAVEAMLLNVPVITMDYTGILAEGVSFIDDHATLHAFGFDELKAAVKRVVNSDGEVKLLRERAEQFVQDMYYKMDGRAVSRCVAGILDLRQSD
jgi:hypothetical protein